MATNEPETVLARVAKHPLLVAAVGAAVGTIVGFLLAHWSQLFGPWCSSLGRWIERFFFGSTPTPTWLWYLSLSVTLLLCAKYALRGLGLLGQRIALSSIDAEKAQFTELSEPELTWHWHWSGDEPEFDEVRCKEHGLQLIWVSKGFGHGEYCCPTCEVKLRDRKTAWAAVRSHILKILRDRQNSTNLSEQKQGEPKREQR